MITFDADAIRHALSSMGVARLAGALGVRDHRIGQGRRTLRAACPVHGGKNRTAFVMSEVDGGLVWCCHSDCQTGGDALSLIAEFYDLDVRREFDAVLERAAEIAGVHIEDAPRRGEPRVGTAPPELEPRQYPPVAEVTALWNACRPIGDDERAARYLADRGLDVDAIELFDLARAIRPGTAMPSYARLGGRSWLDTGHTIVVPVSDGRGATRSLRGWRHQSSRRPKRLAAAGCSMASLIMACPLARQILAAGAAPAWWPRGAPPHLVIVEGESDFLTWATRSSDANEVPFAVVGIPGSGSWSIEIAQRIPDGTIVVIRTDHDAAGDRYAVAVARDIGRRCTILRDRRAAA